MDLEKESLENKNNETQQKLLDEVKATKKKIDALIKVNVYSTVCEVNPFGLNGGITVLYLECS